MNDRELIEIAAKAAGYTVDTWRPSCDDLFLLNEKGDATIWNPITNDGDALRLAVKLQIPIAPAYTYKGPWDDGGTLCDPYAATRRAIVSAAAEIGKAVK